MKKEQLKEMIKGLVQEILIEGNSQFRVGDVVIHDGSKCTVIEVDPKDGSLSIEDNKTGMSWDLVDPYDVKKVMKEGIPSYNDKHRRGSGVEIVDAIRQLNSFVRGLDMYSNEPATPKLNEILKQLKELSAFVEKTIEHDAKIMSNKMEEGLFVYDQSPEQVKRANHADGYDAEEERRRMHYHRPENNPIQGVTFFNVPVEQEETAKQIGLSHFPKSKKWGMKHFKGRGINRAILVKAEQAFGKGRYWEPTR